MPDLWRQGDEFLLGEFVPFPPLRHLGSLIRWVGDWILGGLVGCVEVKEHNFLGGEKEGGVTSSGIVSNLCAGALSLSPPPGFLQFLLVSIDRYVLWNTRMLQSTHPWE